MPVYAARYCRHECVNRPCMIVTGNKGPILHPVCNAVALGPFIGHGPEMQPAPLINTDQPQTRQSVSLHQRHGAWVRHQHGLRGKTRKSQNNRDGGMDRIYFSRPVGLRLCHTDRASLPLHFRSAAIKNRRFSARFLLPLSGNGVAGLAYPRGTAANRQGG